MSNDIEREAFEKWLLDRQGLVGDWDDGRNLYEQFPAHLAWKAWQAARARGEASSAGAVPEGLREAIEALGPEDAMFGIDFQDEMATYHCQYCTFGMTHFGDTPRADQISHDDDCPVVVLREVLTAAPTAPAVHIAEVVSVSPMDCTSVVKWTPELNGHVPDAIWNIGTKLYTHPHNGEQGGEWYCSACGMKREPDQCDGQEQDRCHYVQRPNPPTEREDES